jgi:hypothetical protein
MNQKRHAVAVSMWIRKGKTTECTCGLDIIEAPDEQTAKEFAVATAKDLRPRHTLGGVVAMEIV